MTEEIPDVTATEVFERLEEKTKSLKDTPMMRWALLVMAARMGHPGALEALEELNKKG